MPYYDSKTFDSLFGNLTQTKKMPKGSILFLQGKNVESIYFVETGKVKVETHEEGGSSLVLYYAGPGMAIAEDQIFLESYGYSATVEEDAVVRHLPKDVFQDRLKNDPTYSHQFMQCLSSRYCDLRVLCNLLTIRRADDRLYAYFKWHGLKEGYPIDVQGRTGILGEMLGLTKESIYRAIARLEKKGSISRKNGLISVHSV